MTFKIIVKVALNADYASLLLFFVIHSFYSGNTPYIKAQMQVSSGYAY